MDPFKRDSPFDLHLKTTGKAEKTKIISVQQENSSDTVGTRPENENKKKRGNYIKSLNLITLNCRSLRKKTHMLKDLLDENRIDVALLQETWLQGDLSIYAEFKEIGYKIKKLERTKKRGGGLAVLAKSSTVRKLSSNRSYSFKGFDNITCKLNAGKLSMRLVNLYRPPENSKSDFLTEFQSFLLKLQEVDGMVIIMGDFNINWLNKDHITIKFSKILAENGFTQIVQTPTRESATLDFVIIQDCYKDLLNIASLNHNDFKSDHIPIFLRCQMDLPFCEREFIERRVRDYHLLNRETMKQDLNNSQLVNTQIIQNLSSSSITNLYNSTISTIMDRLCPIRVKVFKRDKSKRWFNKDLRQLKQERRKYERAYKKHPSIENKKLYQKAKNKYTWNLKTARINFFSTNIAKYKNESKNLFNCLKDLTGTKNETIIPSRASNSEIAEEFSDFYVAKVSNIRETIQATRNLNTAPISFDINTSTQTVFSSFKLISMDELKGICSSLNKKTCSLDPAPTKIIIENFDILSPAILQIVNKTILDSTFPNTIKHAVVTPILKQSSLNPEELKNYRPVSSIPFVSKIIERAIYDQLDNYLETNNLYPYFQSAYRKNYSCESALVELMDDLQKKVIVNEEETVLILLDSSAAFDTVDHQILINKLENEFNIKDNALKLITSYLHKRTFSTKINDMESSPRDLRYGVPQGSLLGPLFYNLYTKTIEKIATKHGLKIITYADDCQLYISYKTPDRILVEEKVNKCLQDLKIWMDNVFLKLNAGKTIVKVFRPTVSRLSQSIPTQFLNFDLADSIKTLGVSINGKLKFDNFIANKVKICNMHLRNLYNIRHCLDHSTRVLLVTNQILSTIDYCNPLLLGATNKSLRPLELIINRSILFIYNLRYDEHITPFYKKLHFLPIRQMTQYKACLIAYKILHEKAPLYLRQHFTPYVQRSSMHLREGSGRDHLMFIRNSDDVKNQRLTTKIQNEWYILSFRTRNSPSLSVFKTRLKTELFSRF